MTKRFLSFRDAVRHPDVPFTDERQLRNTFFRAKPVVDSRGTVHSPGDIELLSCFVKFGQGERATVLLDVERLRAVVEARRLGGAG